MKKKLLSLALVLVMALTLLPTAAFATDGTDDGTTPSEGVTTPCTHENKIKVNASPATCVTPGTEAYWICANPSCDGGDLKFETNDADARPVVDNSIFAIPATGVHTWDADGSCTTPGCSAKCDHGGATTGECPDCGKTLAPAEPPAGQLPNVITSAPSNAAAPEPTATPESTTTTNPHELKEEVAATAATCTEPAYAAYYTCKHCSLLFSDKDLTTVIAAKTQTGNPLGHSYSNGYCTRCKERQPGNNIMHEHKYEFKQAQAASCTEKGLQSCYTCVCGKYFLLTDSTYVEVSASQIEIPAKGHTRPADTTGYTRDSAYQHSYTCPDCKQVIKENHVPDSNRTCTLCGLGDVLTSPTTPTPNPSYRYIDITSAYVGDYSISVTWTSDLPSGTYFDIYVDGGFQTTVAPSKSSGYFSYTVDFSHYLGDNYYTVAVYARDDHAIYDSIRTYNRYYDHDYWYPDHWYPNSTPSTNSYGIPNASQVNGRYSAAEAIRILRGKNQYNLQNDLMSSSSALDSFERLERAVKDANHVSVNVSSSRSGVPSVFRSGVSITGAAFNASSTNSTVSLVLDAPSVNRYAGRGYQFSMSLTGVGGDSSLDVPVIVSLPLPSDISPNYVKVLHYHNSNTPTVITPQVSGGKIRFPLTGFSDFVVTDGGVPNYTYVSDGYGGYYVPVGTVARQSLVDQHLAAVLPIIAANAANGYIFDDVSGTYWAAPQIAWVKDGGLMTGYYDGTFRPYSGTTRQELWMVLARLAGANPADMWAAREWAMNVGITDGTNPYAPLSNQQMITMLYRYASYRRMNLTAPTTMLSIYHDSASVSPYARTPMAWAINQGIVTGNGTGYLYPQNIATRADFAVYLYRFLQ